MSKKVLATVNGIEITADILDRTIELLPPERRGYFDSEFGRKQLLDQLVSVELINAFGTDLGLENDPEYQVQMEQAAKDIKYSFTMNKIMSTITVDDEEAARIYETHPERYKGQETVTASHVLVDDEALAKEIIAKIESEELSFADAATEYSSCPSKEQGGNLGEFGRGMMVKEFEEAAFAMEAGEMTKMPVKTQFGYHVILTTDKQGDAPKSFDEVKDEVKSKMLQDKQMEYYTKLVQELKEKFEVTMHE